MEENLKDINKNSIHFKAIYQDKDWLYQKLVVEGLNQKEAAQEANCTVRVLRKWAERHRILSNTRREDIIMNEIQSKLVIGSLLGDGHIDKREEQPIFIVSHAENQKDYLYWKYNLLRNIMNSAPKKYKGTIKVFNGKEYLCQPWYRISSRIINDLKRFRNMSKMELINNLDEFSLSIWFLDDGNRNGRKHNSWDLCFASLNENEKECVVKVLKEVFDIESKISNCDNRYLKINVENSKKLDKIILNNIPNNLDIIKYKIIDKTSCENTVNQDIKI